MLLNGDSFQIRAISDQDLTDVLEVYRQCEDFLALGPEPIASTQMVAKDIEYSRQHGGIFCGIYDAHRTMLGVVDVVPESFANNPGLAFIKLLLIVGPHRRKGLGTAVLKLIEATIQEKPQITANLVAVQENNPAAMRFWQQRGYRIVSGPERQPDQTIVFYLRKDCPVKTCK
jgi:ribosomal protein S18 acetylase RimI-like enzyme